MDGLIPLGLGLVDSGPVIRGCDADMGGFITKLMYRGSHFCARAISAFEIGEAVKTVDLFHRRDLFTLAFRNEVTTFFP